MVTRGTRHLLGALLLSAATMLGAANARADEWVTSCGPFANHVFKSSSAYGMTATDTCPGGSLKLDATGFSFKSGQGVIWQASAPAGLTITSAEIPYNNLQSSYVNSAGGQYGGDFYWTGGTSNITPNEYGASLGPFQSRDFGFLLVCSRSSCDGLPGANIEVTQITLVARETTPPHLTTPSGIGEATGWVRGAWPMAFWGDSPSGLCALNAYFGHVALPGTTSSHDPSQWHQCAAGPVNDRIVTNDYPQGANPLYTAAWDAAGETVSQTKTVYVDNQTPTVSLTGPSEAASSAGTQYVTATAHAGPSGVAGIECHVDGIPGSWYPERTAVVPVSGVGEHKVQCQAQSNAVDMSGQRAISALATFSVKIGQPTVTALAFTNLVDGLRCRRSTERITVPARWVREHRNGHWVRVRRAAHAKTVHIRRCQVRTRRERVTIWVTRQRNGHRVRVKEHKLVRVVVRPRTVSSGRKSVPHGHAATVSGWLGTTAGVALGGQTVDVLSAPEDGRGSYALVAVVRTGANGGWSARLAPGPSRSTTAVYAGGPTTEGSYAAPVNLVVPAKVDLLRITPRQVAWGGTVRLTGQLEGGYLPPGGALVRLRIGLGKSFITYGVHEHVAGSGRFTTAYTFGAGDPSVRRSYWFQIASLPMGDYPYTPASSRRIAVLVGGHPRAGRRTSRP
jgi:hypothetical protein